MTLTDIANKHCADKGTVYYEQHGYTEHYCKYIPPKGNYNLLEIGVWHGDSLRMWNEYNPDANITGIDIDESIFNHIHSSDKIKIYIGNQSDEKFLQEVVSGTGKLNFIIDDGSHHFLDIKNSFLFLWDHLKEGGFYFIEDLHAVQSERGKIIELMNQLNINEWQLCCNLKLLVICKGVFPLS